MSAKPSEQTRQLMRGQNIWSLWIRRVQVAYLYETEGIDHGRCEKCGRIVGLQGDHVTPKSNFKIILHDPLNGQVLDGWCNAEKGSTHTKGNDHRSRGMIRFYAKAASRHWQQYGLKGIWQITDAGALWLKSGAIQIPGLRVGLTACWSAH